MVTLCPCSQCGKKRAVRSARVLPRIDSSGGVAGR